MKKIVRAILFIALMTLCIKPALTQAATPKYAVIIRDTKKSDSWGEGYILYDNLTVLSPNKNIMVKAPDISSKLGLTYTYDSKTKKFTIKDKKSGKYLIFKLNSKSYEYYSSSKAKGKKLTAVYKAYYDTKSKVNVIHSATLQYLVGYGYSKSSAVIKNSMDYDFPEYSFRRYNALGYDDIGFTGVVAYQPGEKTKIASIPSIDWIDNLKQVSTLTKTKIIDNSEIFGNMSFVDYLKEGKDFIDIVELYTDKQGGFARYNMYYNSALPMYGYRYSYCVNPKKYGNSARLSAYSNYGMYYSANYDKLLELRDILEIPYGTVKEPIPETKGILEYIFGDNLSWMVDKMPFDKTQVIDNFFYVTKSKNEDGIIHFGIDIYKDTTAGLTYNENNKAYSIERDFLYLDFDYETENKVNRDLTPYEIYQYTREYITDMINYQNSKGQDYFTIRLKKYMDNFYINNLLEEYVNNFGEIDYSDYENYEDYESALEEYETTLNSYFDDILLFYNEGGYRDRDYYIGYKKDASKEDFHVTLVKGTVFDYIEFVPQNKDKETEGYLSTLISITLDCTQEEAQGFIDSQSDYILYKDEFVITKKQVGENTAITIQPIYSIHNMAFTLEHQADMTK